MLKSSCTIVREELSSYLQLHTGLGRDNVVVSNLVDASGSPDDFASDKLCISLVNTEHEGAATMNGMAANGRGGFSKAAPPISLNLFLLFSSNFRGKSYEDGLSYLSGVVSFFQDKRVFDHQNTPALDARIERLMFEYVNLKAHDLSHMWGALGAKYIPSLLYKVRMLTFFGEASQTVPAIDGLDHHASNPN